MRGLSHPRTEAGSFCGLQSGLSSRAAEFRRQDIGKGGEGVFGESGRPVGVEGPAHTASQRLTQPARPFPLVRRGWSVSRPGLASGEGGPDSTSLFSFLKPRGFPCCHVICLPPPAGLGRVQVRTQYQAGRPSEGLAGEVKPRLFFRGTGSLHQCVFLWLHPRGSPVPQVRPTKPTNLPDPSMTTFLHVHP